MTKKEFRKLKVGDTIQRQFTKATIVWIEYEYDYDVSPALRVPWAVHLDNGTNLRVSDPWLNEIVKVKTNQEAI